MANDKEFYIKGNLAHMWIAIRRKKENNNEKEICFRVLDKHSNSYCEVLDKIQNFAGVWRIYRTINGRNLEVAAKNLMIELIRAPDLHKHKIDILWKTVLMKPGCKGERNILVDVDSTDTAKKMVVANILFDNKVEIVSEIVTPNGHHFVCKLFDTRIFDDLDYVEIKRDGYVFCNKVVVE